MSGLASAEHLVAATGGTVDLRAAYGCFPSGVAAVCALAGGTPIGIAASSFVAVSLDPPLVSVCVQHTSTTWPRLRAAPRLGLTVLAEDQEDVCRDLAATGGDRFARVRWSAAGDGAVLVHGGALWLDCAVHREVDAGDHVLVLLAVHRLRDAPGVTPLVLHGSRFRRLAAI